MEFTTVQMIGAFIGVGFVVFILDVFYSAKLRCLAKDVRMNTISRKQDHELIFKKIRRLEVEIAKLRLQVSKNEGEGVKKRAICKDSICFIASVDIVEPLPVSIMTPQEAIKKFYVI